MEELDLEKMMQEDVEIPLGADEDEDEAQWELLIDEIMRGNVIPVIGPDFLVAGDKNIHTVLIDYFAKMHHVKSKPKTFSQLVYDRDFLYEVKSRNKIYEKIFSVLEKIKNTPPNEALSKLLSTRKFPFVITTSFTPVAEKAMKNVWGENNVRVLQFRNNPSEDLLEGKGDVLNERDMQKPTVYYMFGKYCREKHRFVVTDLDMMNFCKSWLSEDKSPRTLSDIIKKRYLLILGNNYSDWQFRFIWFSMRMLTENTTQSSLVVSSHPEDSPLIQFLNRLETFTKNNPTEVVDEIVKRINKRKEEGNPLKRYKTDVFLSYSRSDADITKKLYDKLRAKGLEVWFDRVTIDNADLWKQRIVEGVKSSRIFVPILSSNIEREFMDEHEYRTEWKEAATIASKMGGRPFIVPLAEKGFDFYNTETEIPEEFKERNATWYDAESDMENIASIIQKKVNEVKLLKEE